MIRDQDTATLLRRGVLALAALGLAGTAVELIFLRHWSSAISAIVWPALAALAVAFALLVLMRGATRRGVHAARILAGIVVLIAGLGIYFHVAQNLAAGPRDRHTAATWSEKSLLEQWWLAIDGRVGEAPTLAPGALAEISLALLLATVRHPALSTPVPSAAPAVGLD